MVKNLPAVQEMWVRALSQEDPLEEKMVTHISIVFLPGESHGQRSLGLQSNGLQVSDRTKPPPSQF